MFKTKTVDQGVQNTNYSTNASLNTTPVRTNIGLNLTNKSNFNSNDTMGGVQNPNMNYKNTN